MGATTFETAAWGRTPAEAFRSAVESAQWEHGHGGYTGTISEKAGFVEFMLPPRTKARKVIDLMDAALVEQQVEYTREQIAWLEGNLVRTSGADKPAVRKRIRDAKAELKREEREVAKFKRQAGALLPLVTRANQVYDDKWGAAVCFEVSIASEIAGYRWAGPKPKRGYKLYVFCGWASC